MLQDSHPNYLVVRVGLHGLGVFTTKSIKTGETIFTMTGEVADKPTRTSVQIGANKHIEDSIAGFLNHNCQPSAKVDREMQKLIALRDLNEGDEITFDYRQNEEAMAQPFECYCCKNKISGKAIKDKESTTA